MSLAEETEIIDYLAATIKDNRRITRTHIEAETATLTQQWGINSATVRELRELATELDLPTSDDRDKLLSTLNDHAVRMARKSASKLNAQRTADAAQAHVALFELRDELQELRNESTTNAQDEQDPEMIIRHATRAVEQDEQLLAVNRLIGAMVEAHRNGLSINIALYASSYLLNRSAAFGLNDGGHSRTIQTARATGMQTLISTPCIGRLINSAGVPLNTN